ncbi:TPA: O-antigen ligase family protein [Klebsiella quasipneumoniae]|nr:O-antigen ligase family protein [Klebsiella quasipneumoniae]
MAFFSLLYCFYCFIIYFVSNDNDESTLAITKLAFNGGFFIIICVAAVFSQRDVSDYIKFRTLHILERYLATIVILSLIQVTLLQLISGGIRFSSDSSYTAGLMFTDHTIFWGVQDKNIMGAKIALFGFLHAYVYYRLKNKINYFFGAIYVLCSAMTLSRTSLLLSFLTFFLLVFLIIKPIYRYYIIIPLVILGGIIAFPKLAELVRLDSITNVSRDDGMGIRILFWTAFFSRISDVSFWGNGLLSASDFLGRYSVTGSANNMHNLYINNFLDLGVPGSLFYFGFLISMYILIYKRTRDLKNTILMLAPIFVITNTLYTGYDNDTWMYYSVVFVLSNIQFSNKGLTKFIPNHEKKKKNDNE